MSIVLVCAKASQRKWRGKLNRKEAGAIARALLQPVQKLTRRTFVEVALVCVCVQSNVLSKRGMSLASWSPVADIERPPECKCRKCQSIPRFPLQTVMV